MALKRVLKKLIAALPPFRSSVDLAAPCVELGDVVDRLGRLKAAQVAPAQHEDALKAVLVESGERSIEGKLFRAVVSPGGDAVRLDSKAIRAEMGAKWCKKYELPYERAPSVRIYGRTGVVLEPELAAAE